MSEPLRKAWTQEEFFDWPGHGSGRYEFDGVQPVAMTGGSLVHARMIRRLHAALGVRLAGRRCEPLGPDAGVATIGNAIRYPDAVVFCSPIDEATHLVPGPVVVFEVVSPGSKRIDRVVKVREYAAIATVRRYVIVDSQRAGVTNLQRERAGQDWTSSTLGRADVLDMPEIGIAIPVAELYADLPATRD